MTLTPLCCNSLEPARLQVSWPEPSRNGPRGSRPGKGRRQHIRRQKGSRPTIRNQKGQAKLTKRRIRDTASTSELDGILDYLHHFLSPAPTAPETTAKASRKSLGARRIIGLRVGTSLSGFRFVVHWTVSLADARAVGRSAPRIEIGQNRPRLARA